MSILTPFSFYTLSHIILVAAIDQLVSISGLIFHGMKLMLKSITIAMHSYLKNKEPR
jgi:hypothetical protein